MSDSPLPDKAAILAYLAENPTATAKRDIARAFGIKGAARIDLKRMLRELEAEGHLAPRRARSSSDPEALPPVAVIRVTGLDDDGDPLAEPLEWDGIAAPPVIRLVPRPGDPALAEGDRVLARLNLEGGGWIARPIRRLGVRPDRILGVFRAGTEGGRILPIDKGEADQWVVGPGQEGGARDGELVEAEAAGSKGRLGLPKARIVARLGDPTAPRAISLIAIHQHAIPDHFPAAALAQAEAAQPVALGTRTDLRDLPLVTIDPADARDHDDAVLALPDADPANPGGFRLWVAIADVADYVRPGSPLDREARKRGNSTYFPDRVVPMLPEALSADLCSLIEGQDRPVIAVEIVIDAEGEKRGHRFVRGLMRSAASLTYEEAQAAIEGQVSDLAAPLLDPVLRPLFAAHAALDRARDRRQPLDIDLPERRIVLSEAGKVLSVAFKERLTAHRLIEEFMVLANVCAAETLAARRTPLLYRVHEEPSPDKLEALREVALGAGLQLAKGQVLRTEHLNRLLKQAEGRDVDELINLSTLRAMTQAYYAPQNLGHFGLALRNYAHFTSPIRRYSDLIVHRGLIAAHHWDPAAALSPEDEERLDETAKLISDAERRSMQAERDTTDRYLAAFLSDRIGHELTGRISGIARFGVFVKLDESGADGLVPIRSLGAEYFQFDAASQTLTGSDSGRTIGIGQRARVKLAEAMPITGGIILELLELDDTALPRPSGRSGGRGTPRRKLGAARAKEAAERRRVKRTRR